MGLLASFEKLLPLTRREANETIVARWTVPADELREFTRKLRRRYEPHADSPMIPVDVLKACEAHSREGIEVVCRDDAVFVGPWCLAFHYNEISRVCLLDGWMQFQMEGNLYEIPVPIARHAMSEAEHVVAVYARMGAEEYRRAVAARQAPTVSNRLLDIVEPHFLWVALGFFFVGIPVVVIIFGWLRGGFE